MISNKTDVQTDGRTDGMLVAMSADKAGEVVGTSEVVVDVVDTQLVRWNEAAAASALNYRSWYPELGRCAAARPACIHRQSRTAPGTTFIIIIIVIIVKSFTVRLLV